MTRRISLAALSSREFRQRIQAPAAAAPIADRFRGHRLKLGLYDQQWDKKRGTAIRLTTVLLTEDDQALQLRVCENLGAGRTYRQAIGWLEREAATLRRAAKMHETAAARLATVLQRCPGAVSQPSASGDSNV